MRRKRWLALLMTGLITVGSVPATGVYAEENGAVEVLETYGGDEPAVGAAEVLGTFGDETEVSGALSEGTPEAAPQAAAEDEAVLLDAAKEYWDEAAVTQGAEDPGEDILFDAAVEEGTEEQLPQADDAGAPVEFNDYDSLRDAIESAAGGEQYFKLNGDIQGSDSIAVSGKTVTIDLNGHTIRFIGDGASGTVANMMQVTGSANLMITDSKGSGSIMSGWQTVVDARAFLINGGTLRLHGVTISGFALSSEDGAGVYVGDGTVYVSGKVNISGNRGRNGASNVFLANGAKINVTGQLSSDSSIGVSKTVPGVFAEFTNYNLDNDRRYFTSDNADYGIFKKSGTELAIGQEGILSAVSEGTGSADLSGDSVKNTAQGTYKAISGDTVTLKLTPGSGYDLKSLYVTDQFTKDVPTTKADAYTYTFTMTSPVVYVRAVFSPIPSITAPTPIPGLVYNGESQVLIREGSTSGGTMRYAFGDSTAPSGTWYNTVKDIAEKNAGEYGVWYRVDGGDGYADVEPKYISGVEIKKAPLTVTANPRAITYGDAPANNGEGYEGFIGNDNWFNLKGTLEYSYTYQQYDNVGDYIISVSGQTADNYDITYHSGKLTVLPKTVGLDWSDTELTYNGAEQKPIATATGLVNGDAIGVTVTGGKTDTGSYTATASELTGSKAGNYVLPEEKTKVFTIAKADLALKLSLEGWTYGETAKKPSVTGNSGSGAVTYEYKAKEAAESAYSQTQPETAGEYTVRASVAETANYKAGTATADFKIAKAGSTAAVITGSDRTYDGTEKELVTADASAMSGGAMQYVLGTNAVNPPVSGWSTVVPKAADAGTYYVWHKLTGDENHNDTEAKCVEVKISNAALKDVSVKQKGTLTYTGAALTPEVTEAATAVNNQEVTFTYSKTKDGTYGPMPTVTNVSDSATFYYKAIAPNHDEVSGEFTVTVEKAAAIPAKVTVNKWTYDGTKKELIAADASALVGGEMEYALGAETAATGEYTPLIPTGTDAGKYYVWYRVKGDENHNDFAPKCVIAEIYKAPSTPAAVTAAGGTYDGTEKELVTVKSAPLAGGAMQFALGEDAAAPASGWSESLPKATAAGTYYVWHKVVGDSNHRDTDPAKTEVHIEKAVLTELKLEKKIYRETGSVIAPNVAKVMAGSLEVPEAAYTVTSPSSLSEGRYTVTASAKANSNFSGTAEATYHIVKPGLHLFDVVLPKTEFTYTGQPIEPEVTVLDVETDDVLDTANYELTYLDNTEAGSSAKVQVSGKNGYQSVDGGATEVHVFTILKVPSSVKTAPTAKTGLTYAGSAQELVNAGAAEGGAMAYALGTETEAAGEYAAAVPKGTDAGNYYVWYKVAGDKNHTDSKAECIPVTVGRGPVSLSLTSANRPVGKTLTFNGGAQDLVSAPSALPDGYSIEYKLEDTEFAAAIPQGTTIDTYTIAYRYVSNDGNRECVPSGNTVTSSIRSASGDVTTYTLTLTSSPADAAEAPTRAPSRASYAHGAEVTIEAGHTLDAANMFIGWFEGNELISLSEVYNLRLLKDRALTARYARVDALSGTDTYLADIALVAEALKKSDVTADDVEDLIFKATTDLEQLSTEELESPVVEKASAFLAAYIEAFGAAKLEEDAKRAAKSEALDVIDAANQDLTVEKNLEDARVLLTHFNETGDIQYLNEYEDKDLLAALAAAADKINKTAALYDAQKAVGALDNLAITPTEAVKALLEAAKAALAAAEEAGVDAEALAYLKETYTEKQAEYALKVVEAAVGKLGEAEATDAYKALLAEAKAAIEAAEEAGVDKEKLAPYKAKYAEKEAAYEKAVKEKEGGAAKAAETAVTAALQAVEKAAKDPTDANIKAAEDAVRKAESAIAAAKAAGADTAALEKKLAAAKTDSQNWSAFIASMKKLPTNLDNIKEKDRAALEASLAAFGKLSAQQQKNAAVPKAMLDSAKKALDNPKVTFRQAKVRKALKKSGKKTKQIVIRKKLKLKAQSSTGAKITYKSSKPKVASVNAKGVITGRKNGKATITVTCNKTKIKVLVRVKK